MSDEVAFEFRVADPPTAGRSLVVALPTVGMVGLATVDYLVRQREPEPIGHVRPTGIPTVAPFESGRPRQPIRLYDLPDEELAVLVGEQFIPLSAAVPFADALLAWTDEVGIDEIAVLHGVPYPHEETQHAVFHVASDAFRERRLGGDDVPPLPGGILDGFVGELVTRDLEGTAAPVGVLVTPVHPPGPDVEATLRFLEVLESLYGVSVDVTELEELSAELRDQFAEMADRMQGLREGAMEAEYPADRMYM